MALLLLKLILLKQAFSRDSGEPEQRIKEINQVTKELSNFANTNRVSLKSSVLERTLWVRLCPGLERLDPDDYLNCICAEKAHRNEYDVCVCDSNYVSNGSSCNCPMYSTEIDNSCECLDTFEWNADNSDCVCIENSAYSNGVCECNSGSVLDTNANSCVCIENSAYSNGVCECNSGFVLDTTANSCVCIENSTLVDGVCQCNSSFIWNSTTESCVCPQNSALVDGVCQCNSSFIWNSTTESCVCPQNSAIVDGVCECLNGYYKECLSECKCKPCSSECQTCSGQTNQDCDLCKDGSSPKQNTCCLEGQYIFSPGNCKVCPPNCLACTEEKCTECKPEKTLYSNDLCECIAEELPDGTCRFPCTSDQYIQEGVCYNCPTLCNACSSTECTACKEGILDSNGLCKCEQGKYQSQDKCLDCPDLCKVCSNSVCENCQENAELNNEGTCECLEGFQNKNGLCLEKVRVSLIVTPKNNLVLVFSEELFKNLTESDFDLEIKLPFNMTFEQINKTHYLMSPVFQENVKKGTLVRVVLSEGLQGISGAQLNQTEVSSTLNKQQINSGEETASELKEVFKVITTSALSASILTLSTSNLCILLSAIQMLAFIPLGNYSISNSQFNIFKSFQDYHFIPNPFEHFISEDAKPSEALQEAGFESSLFLANCGEYIFIGLGVLVLYGLFGGLSLVFDKAKALLKVFNLSALGRWWIVFYTEIAFASAVNLLYPDSDVVNAILSGIFGLFALASPVVILVVSLANKNSNLSTHWVLKAFFCEVKTEDGLLKKQLYTVLLSQRALYSLNQVFIPNHYAKSTLNGLLSLGSLCYLVAFRPYKSKILQANSLASHIGQGFIFTVLGCLNFGVGDQELFETLVNVSAGIVIWFSSGSCLVDFFVSVFNILAKSEPSPKVFDGQVFVESSQRVFEGTSQAVN